MSVLDYRFANVWYDEVRPERRRGDNRRRQRRTVRRMAKRPDERLWRRELESTRALVDLP